MDLVLICRLYAQWEQRVLSSKLNKCMRHLSFIHFKVEEKGEENIRTFLSKLLILQSTEAWISEWSEVLSHVLLFATPWTVAYQASLSMGFSRQQYWGGLPFTSPEDLPKPGIELRSFALQAAALPSEPPGKPWGMNMEFIWLLIPGNNIFLSVTQKITDPLLLWEGISKAFPCYSNPQIPGIILNPWILSISLQLRHPLSQARTQEILTLSCIWHSLSFYSTHFTLSCQSSWLQGYQFCWL